MWRPSTHTHSHTQFGVYILPTSGIRGVQEGVATKQRLLGRSGFGAETGSDWSGCAAHTDPNRCERGFDGNTIGQANGVSDKVLDIRCASRPSSLASSHCGVSTAATAGIQQAHLATPCVANAKKSLSLVQPPALARVLTCVCVCAMMGLASPRQQEVQLRWQEADTGGVRGRVHVRRELQGGEPAGGSVHQGVLRQQQL